MLDTSNDLNGASPGKRLLLFSLFGFAVLAALIGAAPTPARAQNTFQVDDRGDAGDVNLGDGTCSTEAGVCTLRAAIEEANANSGADTIEFGNIPTTGGFAVISTGSELQITETLTLDGTTAPGWSESGPPRIVLDGSGMTVDRFNGLQISGAGAAGTSVRALAILNFSYAGISVRSGAANTQIASCYIGIDVDGTTAAGNSDGGISIQSGADGVVIGSNGFTGNGNVISGNGFGGISVTGDNVTIGDNYIGTTATGDAAVPNDGSGIVVWQGATGAQIGNFFESSGSEIHIGNVISGNNGSGIRLLSVGSDVQANRIGTNAAGDTAIPNQSVGISIEQSGNIIGPKEDGPGRNIISGNQIHGVSIRKFFSNQDLTDNIIRFNYIGTDQNAANPLGNAEGSGIHIDGSTRTSILGNVIGSNYQNGITLVKSSRDTLQGNYIGTNEAGDALGNGLNGIVISESSRDAGIVVGSGYDVPVAADPSPEAGGAGNRIAYNIRDGISILAGPTTGVAMRGNLIYNNVGGGIDLGNDGSTPNDDGDGDSGPNNLQNTPEIDRTQTQYNATTDRIEVRYRVRCAPTNCNYGTSGLRIDIYLADGADSGQGEVFLHSDTYQAATAPNYRMISFAPPSGVTVTRDDVIVATATDADNNTSEFSPLNSAPEPDPSEPVVFGAPSPNPAQQQVTFTLGLQESQPVRVVLYDLLGRPVATLYEGTPTAGEEETITRTLPLLPSGRYFLRLEGPGIQSVQPVTVVH